jgi:hypothetical protein
VLAGIEETGCPEYLDALPGFLTFLVLSGQLFFRFTYA